MGACSTTRSCQPRKPGPSEHVGEHVRNGRSDALPEQGAGGTLEFKKKKGRGRVRRGGMKKKLLKKKVDLKIMLSNVRGFNSKKDVIDKIIDVVKPSVICLNETGLRGKSKINIKGYSSLLRIGSKRAWEVCQPQLKTV